MSKPIPRPVLALNAISKAYPEAWKAVDLFRSHRGNGLPNWPDWCFLPFAAWYHIVSSDGEMTPRKAQEISKLAALGTWRYTQGIYRFDQTVYESLINTDMNREIPTEVLYRLPQWCVYIETPDHPDMYGFYASLECDTNSGHHELRLLIDASHELIPLILHLGKWTIEEALSKSFDMAISNQIGRGFDLPLDKGTIMSWALKYAKTCLPFVLYLCSDEPDIERIENEFPSYPHATKTKDGMRWFAAPKPKIWHIGETVGRQIREWQEPTGETRNSPRPHVRRAHWHGYWSGAKGTDTRRFGYKWLPPIFVNTIGLNEVTS